MPQHADHAGVMWHGTYFNWLEESRIHAFEQSGLKYSSLINNNFELPVISINIEYLKPIYLNDVININSYFESSRSPKIIIQSTFINDKKIITSKAIVKLVLIKKDTFSLIRKRPEFFEKALKKLCEGNI